jgi:hypothetical protein
VLGVVAPTCNPTLGRLKQDNYDFEASLDYYIDKKESKQTSYQNK